MNDLEVEERVRATLHAVADAGYDDLALAELDTPVADGRERGRNLVRAAAAVAAIALIAATTIVATRGDHNGVTIGGAIDTPRTEWHTTTAPLFAPTWLPSNLHLLQISSGFDQLLHASTDTTTQLFGTSPTTGAHSEAFEVTTTRVGAAIEGTTVRVRGFDARIDHDFPGGFSIAWIENRDYDMFARFRGITPDRAIAILDALRPRAGQLLNGFDPTTAPVGLRLLGETYPGSKPNLGGDLRYATSLTPGNLGLTDFIVRTQTPGDTAEYLDAVVQRAPAADGSVEIVGSVPLRGGRESRQMRVLWPDGRSIEITSEIGTDDATLRHIARSAQLLDAPGAEALRADVDSRLAALPLKGTVTIDGATLELRGASQPLAVCLRLGTQPPVCAELQSASGPGIDGVVVGGQWIVFAATATSAHFDVDGKTVHARQAMLDGWHLALVLPGSHGTTVNVSGDSSTNRPGS